MSSLSFDDLHLKLPLRRAAEAKARCQGMTAPQYISSLIKRDVEADRALDEILKPVREDFRKSGVTEEQLDQIIERARVATSSESGVQ